MPKRNDDTSLSVDRPSGNAKRSLVALNAAATNAPERTKSRRDKAFLTCRASSGTHRLDMRGPALFILPSPHLHRVWVSQDTPVFRVQMQLSIDFPGDIRKLQHRHRHVPDSDGSVELLPLADSRDEVREVRIGHRIAPQQVRRRSSAPGLEFVSLISFEIVYLVTIAIDQHRARRAHD